MFSLLLIVAGFCFGLGAGCWLWDGDYRLLTRH